MSEDEEWLVGTVEQEMCLRPGDVTVYVNFDREERFPIAIEVMKLAGDLITSELRIKLNIGTARRLRDKLAQLIGFYEADDQERVALGEEWGRGSAIT